MKSIIKVLTFLLFNIALLQCMRINGSSVSSQNTEIDDTESMKKQIDYIEKAIDDRSIVLRKRQEKASATIKEKESKVADNFIVLENKIIALLNELQKKLLTKSNVSESFNDLYKRLASVDSEVNRLVLEIDKLNIANLELPKYKKAANENKKLIKDKFDRLMAMQKKITELHTKYGGCLDLSLRELLELPSKEFNKAKEKIDKVKKEIVSFKKLTANRVDSQEKLLLQQQKQLTLQEIDILKEESNQKTGMTVETLLWQMESIIQNNKNILEKGPDDSCKNNIAECMKTKNLLIKVRQKISEIGANAIYISLDLKTDDQNIVLSIPNIEVFLYKLDCNDSDIEKTKINNDKTNTEFRETFTENLKLIEKDKCSESTCQLPSQKKGINILKKTIWNGHKSFVNKFGNEVITNITSGIVIDNNTEKFLKLKTVDSGVGYDKKFCIKVK